MTDIKLELEQFRNDFLNQYSTKDNINAKIGLVHDVLYKEVDHVNDLKRMASNVSFILMVLNGVFDDDKVETCVHTYIDNVKKVLFLPHSINSENIHQHYDELTRLCSNYYDDATDTDIGIIINKANKICNYLTSSDDFYYSGNGCKFILNIMVLLYIMYDKTKNADILEALKCIKDFSVKNPYIFYPNRCFNKVNDAKFVNDKLQKSIHGLCELSVKNDNYVYTLIDKLN